MTPHPREVALVPHQSALLIIDVQNHEVGRRRERNDPADAWYLERLATVTIPALQRLQAGFRRAGVEVLQTTIESLTKDGRDRSLDYKITPIHVPKGSWDARPIDEIAPLEDEIVIPKTSSSVFVSTNIDYVLRNLGVRQLVVCGLLTDQCVESAVRDACDLGYLVTLVTDASATYTPDRHSASLAAIGGYCRQRTANEVIAELA
ncbi:MAG: isochorismatase family cysteine hydrolase [Geminicoccaceae bacterium]